MTKGGGKPKGRPRKLVTVVSQPQLSTPTPVDEAECSYTAASISCVLTGGENLTAQQIEPEKLPIDQQVPDVNAEAAKEAITQKVEEGEAPPLRKRGMALGYVPPVLKQGIPTARLCRSEIEKETEKWKKTIILYVIGDTPTIAYLKIFLLKQCEVMGKFEIFYHNEGYFVIRFKLQHDKDKLLGDGPLMIANRPIVVKDWVANFCFEKEVLKEVPLWIRLPKLPLSCWSEDSLSQIGSVIGKPVCADECTSQQMRISMLDC